MNPGKLLAKKSKKRKASEDQSSDEYGQKRTGKLRKASKANKKQAEPKKKSEKGLDKYGLESSSESDSQKEQRKKKKVNYVPIELFNPDKIFTEILNKASKEPDFLIMLKNLLSGCSRVMTDKKNMYIKKWRTLRASNCNQDEYLSREAELKRAENDDKLEMERDIMTKLSYANIKGFETRSWLIENYKKQAGATNSQSMQEAPQYQIDDEVWQKYYQAQKKLLAMMMKQNDFVSQDYIPSNLIKTYSENIKDKDHAIKEQVFEDNQLGVKFNNIDSEENPEATQFLFCKHYKEVDYEKVFANGINSFKVYESEKFYIEPKAMSWLLELKSDQIYQNDSFQKESHKRYNELLRQVYESPQKYSDSQVISHLLQVGAYILNAVHYYQKFKLKCELLHPLDLLLVIEKVKKQRRKAQKTENHNHDMVDEKYDRVENQVININQVYEKMAEEY